MRRRVKRKRKRMTRQTLTSGENQNVAPFVSEFVVKISLPDVDEMHSDQRELQCVAQPIWLSLIRGLNGVAGQRPLRNSCQTTRSDRQHCTWTRQGRRQDICSH